MQVMCQGLRPVKMPLEARTINLDHGRNNHIEDRIIRHDWPTPNPWQRCANHSRQSLKWLVIFHLCHPYLFKADMIKGVIRAMIRGTTRAMPKEATEAMAKAMTKAMIRTRAMTKETTRGMVKDTTRGMIKTKGMTRDMTRATTRVTIRVMAKATTMDMVNRFPSMMLLREDLARHQRLATLHICLSRDLMLEHHPCRQCYKEPRPIACHRTRFLFGLD